MQFVFDAFVLSQLDLTGKGFLADAALFRPMELSVVNLKNGTETSYRIFGSMPHGATCLKLSDRAECLVAVAAHSIFTFGNRNGTRWPLLRFICIAFVPDMVLQIVQTAVKIKSSIR